MMVNRIKGPDGKPVRTEPGLEDRQKHFENLKNQMSLEIEGLKSQKKNSPEAAAILEAKEESLTLVESILAMQESHSIDITEMLIIYHVMAMQKELEKIYDNEYQRNDIIGKILQFGFEKIEEAVDTIKLQEVTSRNIDICSYLKFHTFSFYPWEQIHEMYNIETISIASQMVTKQANTKDFIRIGDISCEKFMFPKPGENTRFIDFLHSSYDNVPLFAIGFEIGKPKMYNDPYNKKVYKAFCSALEPFFECMYAIIKKRNNLK